MQNGFRRAAALLARLQQRHVEVAAGGRPGTVLLPFGRYFAARADLLTREGYKTITPIDGVSPFSGVGDPDPELQRFADGERVNERVQIDVRKDLATRLADADAEFLVVDNSAALLHHCELNGRLYAFHRGEETDFTDLLARTEESQPAARPGKLSQRGFDDDLRATYDHFISACLDTFRPEQIILVRSHLPRFWVGDDGRIAPTGIDRRDARFLDSLDDYFLEHTGCQESAAALSHVPADARWQAGDHRLRRAIEEDLVACCTHRPGSSRDSRPPSLRHVGEHDSGAADHVVTAFRQRRPVDPAWLLEYFRAGGASYDDLLALAYLEQTDSGRDVDLLRDCVRAAVHDPESYPAAVTKWRFDRSVHALRGWRWCTLRLPSGHLWAPQITVSCDGVHLRFLGDGAIGRVPVVRLRRSEIDGVVDGRLPITPLQLGDAVGSWPLYLERGRRGVTTALRVLVADAAELVDSCSWLDWATVIDNESVEVTTWGARPTRGVPAARTDLSFVFAPDTRICTVGGGLMDQITHIALFDDLCTPAGLDYYLDDLRYIWWRSHNGFEASRLAPQLERRRLTRLVSQALIESFRHEVGKVRLPWLFNQSQVWYDFGLRDATVVTRDYFNARRLVERNPDFPVQVYTEESELGEFLRKPPSRLCFYTTQHRIPIVAESATALRRVFSYRLLESCRSRSRGGPDR